MLTLFGLLVLPSFTLASTGGDRLARACEAGLKGKARAAAICGCVKKNAEKKLKAAELGQLADAYEKKPGSEEKLTPALADFDSSVSERCTADPKWNLAKTKR